MEPSLREPPSTGNIPRRIHFTSSHHTQLNIDISSVLCFRLKSCMNLLRSLILWSFLFTLDIFLAHFNWSPCRQQIVRVTAGNFGRKLRHLDDSAVDRVVYYMAKCHFTFVTRPWPFCGVLHCVPLPGWVNIAFSSGTRMCSRRRSSLSTALPHLHLNLFYCFKE